LFVGSLTIHDLMNNVVTYA